MTLKLDKKQQHVVDELLRENHRGGAIIAGQLGSGKTNVAVTVAQAFVDKPVHLTPEPTVNPDRETVAGLLFTQAMLDRGKPMMTWADCPDEFREGWCKRADAILALFQPEEEFLKDEK